MRQAARRRWTDAGFVFALFLGALWVAVGKYGAARVTSDADHFLIMFPGYLRAARAIASGRLPLWNSLAQCGMPQLASLESAALYPPVWLFAVLPAAAALQVFIVLHWTLAGAGTYALARARGLRPVPAFVAGFSYQFSGCLLWLFDYSFFPGLCLAPLLFLAVERLVERPTAWRLAAAAAAVGLPLYAGHPQIWAAALPAAGAYAVFASRRAPRRGRALALCAAALAAGLLLAAPVCLPGLELLRLSVRGAAPLSGHVLPLSAVALKLLFFGRQAGESGSACLSAGPLVLGLALAALFARGRRSEIAFWWALAAAAGLVGLGATTPLWRVFRLLPVYGHFSVPERYFFLAALALALLAGFALDERLSDAREPGRRRAWLEAAAVALPCLAAAAVERRWLSVIFERGFSPAAAAAALALWLAGLAALLRCRSRRGLSLGVLAALAASFWRLEAADLVPTSAAELRASLRPGPAARAVLARWGSRPFPPRVAGFFDLDDLYLRMPRGPGVPADSLWKEGAEELFAADATENVGLANASVRASAFTFRSYVDIGLAEPEAAGAVDARLLAPDNPILDRLSVDYVAVPRWERRPEVLRALRSARWSRVFEDGIARVYRNRRALPRFRFARLARRAGPSRPDPAGLFLSGADAVVGGGFPGPLAGLGPGRVAVVSCGDGRIDLRARVEGERGLLVDADTFYPGWRALVDGRPARLFRVDGMIRGVLVPHGAHEVVFEYSPRSFWLGVLLAAAGLAALAAYGLARGAGGFRAAGAGLLLLLLLGGSRAQAGVQAEFAPAQAAAEADDDARAYALAGQALAEVERASGPDAERTLEAVGRHGYFAYLARRRKAFESDVRRLSAVRPPTRASLSELAHLLRLAGRDREALAAARRAVRLWPDDAKALREQGEALLALRRVDDAVVSIASAAALSPDDYWLQIRLSQLYRMVGRDEDAARAYRRARAEASGQQPSIEEAYSRLYSGDGQGAVREFAAIAASSPTDPIPLHHLAQGLFTVGRSTEGIADFEKARRLFEAQGRVDLDYVHTLNNLAIAYWRTGKRSQAAATASVSLAVLEKQPVPFWVSQIGPMFLMLREKVPEISRLARRALETCAEQRCDTLVEASLRLIEARSAEQLGRPSEALEQAGRALTLLEPFRLKLSFWQCAQRARLLAQAGKLFESYGRRGRASRAYALVAQSSSCITQLQAVSEFLRKAASFDCRSADRAGEERALAQARLRLPASTPWLVRLSSAPADCPAFTPPDAPGAWSD